MKNRAFLSTTIFATLSLCGSVASAQTAGGPQSCFDNEEWSVDQGRCVCVAGTERQKGAAFGTRTACVDKKEVDGASATVSLGGQSPAADKADDEEASLPGRVPWRGTNFTFITGATTTAVGIGRDNISSNHEAVSMIGLLSLRYALIDKDAWSLGASLSAGAYVELTDSNSTVTQREPQLTDMALGSSASYKRAAKKWGTVPGVSASVAFPTSKFSRSNGTIMKTSLGLSVSQSFPWWKDVPVLEDMSASFSFKWGHHFSDSTTAVNADLDRERQMLTGGSQLDDQLSGGRFAQNSTVETIGLRWGKAFGGVPLSATVSFVFGQGYKAPFENGTGDQCVPIVNVVNEDCTVLSGQGEPVDNLYSYGFNAALGVQPAPELSVSLAYGSSAGSGQNTLAPDGTRRSIFYSPSAEFALSLTFHPDALYERLTGPKRKIAAAESTPSTF